MNEAMRVMLERIKFHMECGSTKIAFADLYNSRYARHPDEILKVLVALSRDHLIGFEIARSKHDWDATATIVLSASQRKNLKLP